MKIQSFIWLAAVALAFSACDTAERPVVEPETPAVPPAATPVPVAPGAGAGTEPIPAAQEPGIGGAEPAPAQ